MSAYYEIQIAGCLSADWSAWFAGFTLRAGPSDTTFLIGSVPDQAALFGVLNRIRDIGVPLLSLRLVAEGETARKIALRPVQNDHVQE